MSGRPPARTARLRQRAPAPAPQDGYNYNEKRLPAYCDRILWRSAAGLAGAMGPVQAAGGVSTSDHKPVAALLRLRPRPPRPAWWPRAASAAAAAAAVATIAAGRVMVPVTWRLEFLALEVRRSPPARSSWPTGR